MFVVLPETFQVFENLEGLPGNNETIYGLTIVRFYL